MTIEPVADRFCRYVQIDTRSDEESTTSPSTPGQWDLLKLLQRELAELGLEEITLSEHGVLMATLPANLPEATAAKVPTIGFLAHVDTYAGTPGAGVTPRRLVYEGGDITLPGDPTQVIRAAECAPLADFVGHELITSDGTTLLGADDKAGVAEIMTALATLRAHPERRHGRLRIGFTPDEEVGRGTEHFDVAAFGAKVAYTMDGSVPGEIEDETFCADTAVFAVTGHDHHPGYAKGILKNALLVIADLIARLPREAAPETTDERQGYLHAYAVSGGVGEATLKVLVRDFTVAGLKAFEARLEEIRRAVELLHPGVKVALKIEESYRNMKLKLDETPEAVAHALEAVRRAGLTPRMRPIRGGTDGSRLTFAGLPTPNVFAGGVNFHSKCEWVAVSAMEQATTTILHLVDVWREWGERQAG
jgi:tripeptide aminopeptidase